MADILARTGQVLNRRTRRGLSRKLMDEMHNLQGCSRSGEYVVCADIASELLLMIFPLGRQLYNDLRIAQAGRHLPIICP